ncbi:hypothetical protein LINPERPRIM_LOCUS26962 [Linum perenne]
MSNSFYWLLSLHKELTGNSSFRSPTDAHIKCSLAHEIEGQPVAEVPEEKWLLL